MARPRSFLLGLFVTALATLVLEVVNTRVFSTLAWYHLAFLAISLAMLGMTAAAVFVYLRPARFSAEHAGTEIVRFAALFALSLPLCHLVSVVLGLPTRVGVGPLVLLHLIASCTISAVPFFMAGAVITLCLTKVELPIGRIYAVDLAGASLGCLAAVAGLDLLDPTSLVMLVGALQVAAVVAFARGFDRRSSTLVLAWGVLLGVLGAANHVVYPHLLRVPVMKGRLVPRDLAVDRWNSHSRVTAPDPREAPPAYWGPGRGAPKISLEQLRLQIDGDALTVCTAFDGDAEALQWVRVDVTSLPYHLRGTGRVAVIGVGGGRDLLTALAFGCEHVTGIELNRTFLDLLRGPWSEFAGLSGRPDVTLVHDEGRSFMTRSSDSYDLIQMSLIDTWAATTAGAMTLSENGLYTVEAWDSFLERLAPGGIYSVSRWFSPRKPGETARLLTLAVATLQRRGVVEPAQHVALASTDNVATLLLSRDPLSSADVAALEQACERYGFTLLAAPGRPVGQKRLARILATTDADELRRAVQSPLFDFSAPTDERPFFFNMLKPSAWFRADEAARKNRGIYAGNIQATKTLTAILIAVTLLTAVTIVGPLMARGRDHGLARKEFLAAAAYFSLIGLGFMLVEIALIQRFSILLGRPIYSMAITLMSMILATGAGSLVSDRLRADAPPLALPLVIAAAVVLARLGLSPWIELTVGASLLVRAAAVAVYTFPLGFALGFCFPLGMRMLRSHSPAAMSWMWGLNGALSVLGSVLAIFVSMGFGIHWSLLAGGACYLALVPSILALRR